MFQVKSDLAIHWQESAEEGGHLGDSRIPSDPNSPEWSAAMQKCELYTLTEEPNEPGLFTNY